MYVEDVNDEAPVFTQQQYSRLGLRETAGVGTSVIVVRATDRDTGEASFPKSPSTARPSHSCGAHHPWDATASPIRQLPGWGGVLGTVLVASPPDAQA